MRLYNRLVPGWSAYRWILITVTVIFASLGVVVLGFILLVVKLSFLIPYCVGLMLLGGWIIVVCRFIRVHKTKLETAAGYTSYPGEAEDFKADLVQVDPSTGVVLREPGQLWLSNEAWQQARNAARAYLEQQASQGHPVEPPRGWKQIR